MMAKVKRNNTEVVELKEAISVDACELAKTNYILDYFINL